MKLIEPLERRTFLSVGPYGVDPANMGKGEWIWQIPSAEKNTGTTTVQGLADYLKDKGVRWVIVKAGDANNGPIFNYGDMTAPPTTGSWTQFNRELIAAF